MRLAALDFNGLAVDEGLHKDRRVLLLGVGVVDAELALGIGAHGVDNPRACDEDGVAEAAGNRHNWNIVATKPRLGMHLLALTQSLPEAKLATFIISPGKYLREFTIIRGFERIIFLGISESALKECH